MGQAPGSGGADPVVTYRDTGDHVHIVRFASYAGQPIDPVDIDLSQAAGGPAATGTPTGYSSIEGTSPVEHVDYRGQDGHIIELSKGQSAEEWTTTDLTASAHTDRRREGRCRGVEP